MTQAGCRIRWQARNPDRKLTAARIQWTKEEDDALDALMEGCTSWADLTELLKSDEGLAARGRASLTSCWLARQTRHARLLFTATSAVSKSCTPEPVSSH